MKEGGSVMASCSVGQSPMSWPFMAAAGLSVIVSLCAPVPALSADASAGEGQKEADTLSKLRAAHRADPNDARIALDLGVLIYRQNGKSPEARRLLDTASRSFPERHDVHLMLLDSCLAGGQLEAAEKLIRRVQSALDSDQRFAFGLIYYLLQYRQLLLAQEQWNRVHDRVLLQVQKASGQNLEPAVKKKLQMEVGEVLFVQGL
ncbi:MAG: tetratricopeptide repeat protein, partial [Vicinamibacteria bacterium]|nr:tetratricopeptide repeat protein [Vicinamibacteria bacterium]